MLIEHAQEVSWVPYLEGPGYLVGARTWHGLAPLRVFAHVGSDTLVLLRVSRRAARAAGRRVEAGEPARLSYAHWSLDLVPEDSLVYVVSNGDRSMRRRIYRTGIVSALRPLV